MSRILPIKNGLDDRFINQTDVITENALEQVINGQGGGGQKAIIVEPDFSRLDDELNDVAVNSEYALTAQEACTYLNITQDELDALFSGEMQIVMVKRTSEVSISYAVTGDPTSSDPTFVEVQSEAEAGPKEQMYRMSLGDFIYVDGFEPELKMTVPGLKVVSFGQKGDYYTLYKLNNKYGTYYGVNFNA